MPVLPRGIVFDLDGTLVDGFRGIATAVNAVRAAARLAPLDEAEVTRHVGRGLEDLLAALVPRDRLADAPERFREAYSRVAVSESRPMPGAREALDALAGAGLRLSVASNKLARFSRPILDALELSRHLDAVHGPDTAGAAKPDPAMIRACLAAMGVRPDESFYVGDMPLDVEAAEAARVGIILVAGGAASREALVATGAVVLDDLGMLCDHFAARRSGTRLPF